MTTLLNSFFSEEEIQLIEAKNCQNLIGAVPVPVGMAGPVNVSLHRVDQEIHQNIETMRLPLATTEGALVPSINRGCKAIRESGGAIALVEYRGMSRGPVFQCKDGSSAALFLTWISRHKNIFIEAAQEVSSHLKFLDLQGWVQGRLVFVRCSFDPDQAMGMNMVTIATQKAWDVLKETLNAEHAEYEVELLALSGNLCTDKKQAAVNRLLGRGWWVQVEVIVPEAVVEKILKTTSAHICEVHYAKNLVGSYLAGDASQNMHIANAAAALLIATGQDAAHVVDISQGITQFQQTADGLYAAVTLPTVPVGVAGGGTWLPAQQESLKLIGNGTVPSASVLATAIGVASLAGELSGMAALASHHLAKAHQTLGRGQGAS